MLGLKRLTRDDLLSWHRILHAEGWSAPSWPREFGGPGWTAVEQHIFDEECALAGAPPLIPFGVRMVGPVIMQFPPGITVRPIPLIDGEHEVNDIFFDNVEVPVANRVGAENQGWTYAKYLLGHERVNIAQVGQSRRELSRLKQLAAHELSGGRPLLEDTRFRDRIAEVEIDLLALEITVMRVLSAEAAHRDPGAESSVLKIRGAEIQQTLSELMMQAVGYYALPCIPEALEGDWRARERPGHDGPAFSARYFNLRKTTIYSGSNEIQRNIIARRILDL